MLEANLAKLFEAGRIGNLQLKNRIVMPPMGTHWASNDGHVVQRQVDYYAERAKGGVGLVIVEASCVQFPLGRGHLEISVDSDKYLPGLYRLADTIKKNGARAAIQLQHSGAATNSNWTGGLTPVAPSAVQRKGYGPARSLSVAEIKEIINCFIQAAVRVQKAGFDAVEIQGGHAYLLAEFHSPAWNDRNDEYGDSIRGRARVTMEIVSGIKNKIPSLPISCRLNGGEWGAESFGRHGLTLEDAKEIAKLVEASGADVVHVTAYGWGQYALKNIPISRGALLPLAEAVKKVISIPVIAVGRITPEVGEKALREGKADFVAIGRGLIADPYLPQKARTGDIDDIAPCITCFECMQQPRINICSVNARDGEEGNYPYPITKVAKAKKVIIIGGGPGGMEAARVAALRGHDVTLYEKENELGGKLLVLDKPSSKENMRQLNPYLKRQVEKAGVKVKLGTLATAESVLQQCPDAVIVAAGDRPLKPEISGLENAKVINALDFLAGKADVGKKVVIIGGEMVGCEVAEVLAERGGKEVTITTLLPDLATTMLRIPRLRDELLHRLEESGVKFQLGVTYKEVTKRDVVIIDKDGKERVIEADSIILAAGARPDNTLLFELKGRVPEIFAIGDALEPRKIIQAIHEGFKTAYSL